ncbi:hypothetical protein HY041_03485 [Candidatus Roizmanbacteria bacterium]|nr:hypothetical protein [Candidatus Roizmanbacteria bacterium]
MRKIVSNVMFGTFAVTPMMRKWDYDSFPYKGATGMMGQWTGGKLVPWLWLVVAYHVIIALVFLLILVFIAILLWKKIQLVDREEKRKK